MNWFLLATQALISAGGVLLLRASLPDISKNGLSLGNLILPSVGAFLYLASFVIWLYILSENSVSVAYPISIGATLGFVALGAVIFLMILLLTGLFLISSNYKGVLTP
jgi:multidrug transporter EmrE-like cation transporter